MRTWTIALVMLAALGLTGVGAYCFNLFGLRAADTPVAHNTANLEKAKATDMEQALLFASTARDKFANVKDYRALFLRDEYLEGALKENYLILKVRHEPFSVYMEWLAPESKKGRKTVYVDGQNDGKMRVRERIAGSFAVTVSLDPQESIKRNESRHTIKEAGYKNLITKYADSWKKEKDLNCNKVEIQEGPIEIRLPDKQVKLDCNVVTTIHDLKDRGKFTFYRSKLYFNKETGQLVRVEAFDWPETDGPAEGRLVERYTYLNIETDVGLTDADFKF
jgi:hypothetical protein